MEKDPINDPVEELIQLVSRLSPQKKQKALRRITALSRTITALDSKADALQSRLDQLEEENERLQSNISAWEGTLNLSKKIIGRI